MDGQPVKVTWTREDDLHHDYFHTVSVEHLEAGLDAQRQARRLAAPQRGADDHLDLRARRRSTRRRSSWAWASINVPFAIPNVRIENPEADGAHAHRLVPLGLNIPHAFAVQSFVAELAAGAGKDHRDYLLELIGPDRADRPAQASATTWNHGESPERYPVDTGRLRSVIETVTREAGWGRKLPKGQRPRAGGALQLRELRRRRWSRWRSTREGELDDPARGHRVRLRAAGQSRPRALADRRRRASWA